jgi:hypothetical protein
MFIQTDLGFEYASKAESDILNYVEMFYNRQCLHFYRGLQKINDDKIKNWLTRLFV